MNGLRVLLLSLCLTPFAGYSSSEVATRPKDRQDADAWLRNLKKEVESSKLPAYHKSIQQLADLIESDGVVRMYVTQMIEQVPQKIRTFDSVDSLLKAMNLIIRRAPSYKDGTSFPMSTFLHA